MKWKHHKHYVRKALYIVGILLLITFIYHQVKPLPPGVSLQGAQWNISDEHITFLADYTFTRDNETVREHEIFDTLFVGLAEAEESILLDMFLFNNDYSHEPQYREITDELTSLLLEQSDKEIVFITDHLNTFYGSYMPRHLNALSSAGITVVYTDMNKMRDSNPLYTSFWRVLFRWIPLPIRMPHPLGNQEHTVTVSSLLEVATARANHRKVAVIDGTHALITSANPHTASSGHSNVGVLFTSGAVQEILASEQNVAEFSGSDIQISNKEIVTEGPMQMQLLTEGKIREGILQDIRATEAGDVITVMAFYISDRKIVRELKRAAERGVEVVMVLDANKDAFAREKNGIPNRQVARELAEYATIRWYHTTGEQYHTKMIIIEKQDEVIVHLGSANYTKRNLGDYNLEMNVRVATPHGTQFEQDVDSYRLRIVENIDGLFTQPLDAYYDPSRFRYLLYRFQEWTGLSTF